MAGTQVDEADTLLVQVGDAGALELVVVLIGVGRDQHVTGGGSGDRAQQDVRAEPVSQVVDNRVHDHPPFCEGVHATVRITSGRQYRDIRGPPPSRLTRKGLPAAV